jgi:hypothetical protein
VIRQPDGRTNETALDYSYKEVREHRFAIIREIAEVENLPPDRFEETVKRALDEGTAGDGRGFVLMPSAAPYGRTISSTTMRNYETMVRLAEQS